MVLLNYYYYIEDREIINQNDTILVTCFFYMNSVMSFDLSDLFMWITNESHFSMTIAIFFFNCIILKFNWEVGNDWAYFKIFFSVWFVFIWFVDEVKLLCGFYYIFSTRLNSSWFLVNWKSQTKQLEAWSWQKFYRGGRGAISLLYSVLSLNYLEGS